MGVGLWVLGLRRWRGGFCIREVGLGVGMGVIWGVVELGEGGWRGFWRGGWRGGEGIVGVEGWGEWGGGFWGKGALG